MALLLQAGAHAETVSLETEKKHFLPMHIFLEETFLEHHHHHRKVCFIGQNLTICSFLNESLAREVGLSFDWLRKLNTPPCVGK